MAGAVKAYGAAQPYMNVMTSDIADETKVKALIQSLAKQTGIKSSYQPITHTVSVTTIQSGTIVGDSRAAQIKNAFQKESGLQASLKETVKGQAYYTFTTAAISGEANAKTLLQTQTTACSSVWLFCCILFCCRCFGAVILSEKDLRNQNRKKDGSQVSLLTMFLRVIVAGLVYCITFGLGLIASLILIAVREDKRTLHDLIAGTYVTYATPGEEELNADEEISNV